VEWIYLVHDRERWLTLVNAVMNVRVPKMRGISRLAKDLLAYQEELCSVDLVSKLVCLSVFKCTCSWPYRALTVIASVDTTVTLWWICGRLWAVMWMSLQCHSGLLRLCGPLWDA